MSIIEAIAVGHKPTVNAWTAKGEKIIADNCIPSYICMEAMEGSGWTFERDEDGDGEYIAFAVSPSGERYRFDWSSCTSERI